MTFVCTTQADEVPLDHIPADATLIVHLDLDNGKDCEVLNSAVDELLETQAFRDVLDVIPTELDFVRQATWRDITLVQAGSSDESVILIHADSLAQGFDEFCEQSTDFDAIEFDDSTVYQIEIDRDALTDQLGFDISGSQPSPEGEKGPTVFVGRSGDRLVAGYDLDAVLSTFDRVADESLQLSNDAYHALCNIDTHHPVLSVIIAPNSDEEKQELFTGLEGLSLVIGSGQELDLQIHATMVDESQAESYEAWIKSDALTKVFSLLVAASKKDKENGEEVSDAEKAAPSKNQLTFGLSFKGDKEDEFADELGAFLKRSLTCTTEGNVLQLHWKSPARVKTDLTVENGHLSIDVFAEVHQGDHLDARVAEESGAEEGKIDR